MNSMAFLILFSFLSRTMFFFLFGSWQELVERALLGVKIILLGGQ